MNFKKFYQWIVILVKKITGTPWVVYEPPALPVEPVVSEPIPEPEPPADIPLPNGLRHDWSQARSAWLYPGDEDWLASHRMMKWSPDRIQKYLDHPEVRDQTHIIICCNTGTRKVLNEKPFDGLKNPDKVRAVFQQVIANDQAPIAWLLSQEFFIQKLGRSHRKLLEYLEATCEMVSDLCQIAVPFRELGDIYDGNHMQERNEIFKAMRKGAPMLPLAEHERALEGIPVDDFRDVSGDVISGLQTGFKTPTGGQNRTENRVTRGAHTYDGAAGFIRANAERMAEWQRKGRMERHTTAVFEHSLPLIFEGQPWAPTRTLQDAQERGKILLQHGAAFDLSAGGM